MVMAYDRESFLSGLAVGRVLWRPPIVVPDIGTLVIVSAFPSNESIDLNWSATVRGTTYDFVKFRAFVTRDNHPTPCYWYLVKGYNDSLSVMFVSPDPLADAGYRYGRVIGETADENLVVVTDAIFTWSSSTNVDGKFVKREISFEVGELSDASSFWQSYRDSGYLGWDYPGVSARDFLMTAELVERDALYLVGVA